MFCQLTADETLVPPNLSTTHGECLTTVIHDPFTPATYPDSHSWRRAL